MSQTTNFASSRPNGINGATLPYSNGLGSAPTIATGLVGSGTATKGMGVTHGTDGATVQPSSNGGTSHLGQTIIGGQAGMANQAPVGTPFDSSTFMLDANTNAAIAAIAGTLPQAPPPPQGANFDPTVPAHYLQQHQHPTGVNTSSHPANLDKLAQQHTGHSQATANTMNYSDTRAQSAHGLVHHNPSLTQQNQQLAVCAASTSSSNLASSDAHAPQQRVNVPPTHQMTQMALSTGATQPSLSQTGAGAMLVDQTESTASSSSNLAAASGAPVLGQQQTTAAASHALALSFPHQVAAAQTNAPASTGTAVVNPATNGAPAPSIVGGPYSGHVALLQQPKPSLPLGVQASQQTHTAVPQAPQPQPPGSAPTMTTPGMPPTVALPVMGTPAPPLFALSAHIFQSMSLRRGKWTPEEERYANRLIEEFEKGAISDCENGCTLRAFLSRKLHCAPMRISKKFAGKSIGKHIFLARTQGQGMAGNSHQQQESAQKLMELEYMFYYSLLQEGSSGELASAMPGQMIPPNGFQTVQSFPPPQPGQLPLQSSPFFAGVQGMPPLMSVPIGSAPVSGPHVNGTTVAWAPPAPNGMMSPPNQIVQQIPLPSSNATTTPSLAPQNGSAENSSLALTGSQSDFKGDKAVTVPTRKANVVVEAEHYGVAPTPTNEPSRNDGDELPDFLMGFEKAAQPQHKSTEQVRSVARPAKISPSSNVTAPSHPSKSISTAPAPTSPTLTSKSFDDFHQYLGRGISSPLKSGENSDNRGSDGTKDSMDDSDDSEEQRGMPQPPLPSVETTSFVRSSAYSERTHAPVAAVSADSYAMFAQESVLAVSQHSAYCRNDFVPVVSNGLNNFTHGPTQASSAALPFFSSVSVQSATTGRRICREESQDSFVSKERQGSGEHHNRHIPKKARASPIIGMNTREFLATPAVVSGSERASDNSTESESGVGSSRGSSHGSGSENTSDNASDNSSDEGPSNEGDSSDDAADEKVRRRDRGHLIPNGSIVTVSESVPHRSVSDLK